MRTDSLKKLYYSIREVTEITGIEPHVLRFWEKEFSTLRPKRGRSGNRTYKERDIRIILAIKDLLYNQKYTIQGAAERLRNERDLWEAQSLEGASEKEKSGLAELRQMVIDLKRLVEGRSAAT